MLHNPDEAKYLSSPKETESLCTTFFLSNSYYIVIKINRLGDTCYARESIQATPCSIPGSCEHNILSWSRWKQIMSTQGVFGPNPLKIDNDNSLLTLLTLHSFSRDVATDFEFRHCDWHKTSFAIYFQECCFEIYVSYLQTSSVAT